MMNRNVFMLLIIGFTMLACQNSKKENDQPPMEEHKIDKPAHITGGWSESEINDDVKNVANYAVKEIEANSEIEKILSVKTQIVSGRNYDNTFTLKNGEKWNVIVYKNLKNEYSLTKSMQQ